MSPKPGNAGRATEGRPAPNPEPSSLDRFAFQPGDLAACFGTDWISRTIRFGTASLLAPRRLRLGPSHVAILCERRGAPLWLESTTRCGRPCAILGRPLSGVQSHLPVDRVRDYVNEGGRVDVYRLSPIDRLSRSESELLSRILIRRFLGNLVAYDVGGALLSGTRLFKRTLLFPSADANELFCSELVAAVLMRLGRMNRANPTRYNPSNLLRRLVRDGTYQFHASFSQEKSL